VSALAPPRRRIFGVDFSGARDAGKLIWVCEGAPALDGALTLRSCAPVRELPSSGKDLQTALRSLVAFIASVADGAFGCDFPFSLPARLSTGLSWQDYVAGFKKRFPDPDAFQRQCTTLAGGRELKRQTDRDAKVPYGAYNRRLYRQTFHGIGGVLAPLLAAGAATVPPMQLALPGRPVLLEICPASTLKRLGLYGETYKGAKPLHRAARQAVLEGLVAAGKLTAPAPSLTERMLADRGGDALDAAVAAIACAEAIAVPGYDRARDDAELFEGRVYW
jgi:hypothetical protein